MLLFEKELKEVGFDIDYFWKGVQKIKELKEYELPDNEDPEISEIGSWFFFSQVFLLVAERKMKNKKSLMLVEKEGVSKKMSPLAFFLLKYIDGDISEQGVYLLFFGEKELEKEKNKNWMELKLREFFGDDNFISAIKESMSFSDEIAERKKKKDISTIKEESKDNVSKILSLANIELNDYILACREIDRQFVFHDLERPLKMLPYWQNLFHAIADPRKKEENISNQLRSSMLTQGNLSQLEFVIIHYVLLWNKVSEASVDSAEEMFNLEAKALLIMKKTNTTKGEKDSALTFLLNIIKEIVTENVYVETMSVVTQAINYIENEKN